MEEMKKSVVLFYEVLKFLKILYVISGFWEDVFSVKFEDKLNVIYEVVNYKNLMLLNVGLEIM